MIQTAIIGFGMSGKDIHYAHLVHNNSFEIVAIVTKNPEARSFIKKEIPNAKIFDTFHDLMIFDAFDLAILATPNDVHYNYTKDLLIHHKHVLCEKPFVETLEEAEELFSLAHEHNVLLRIYHNRQFDHVVNTSRQLIEEHKLGTLISASFRFDRLRPHLKGNWREDFVPMAGIYYDLAPHLIDYALRLFGPPQKGHLELYRDRPESNVNDHFEILLKYEDFHVTLGAEVLTRYQVPQIVIVGEEATYVKHVLQNPDLVEFAGKVENLPKESTIYTNIDSIHYPLLPGNHYQFYIDLARDIETLPEHDIHEKYACKVVGLMEEMLRDWSMDNAKL